MRNKSTKLVDLLSEIKVNKPTSKQDVLDYLFEKSSYLMGYLTQYSSVEEMMRGLNYNDYTLDEFLDVEWGFEEEVIKKIKIYIDMYYKMFKFGEIYVDTFGDNGTNINLSQMSKQWTKIEIEYIGDDEYYIYCH